MSSLSLSRLLVIFAVIVTAGLVGAFGLQTYSLQTVRINGDHYEAIVQQKNFVSDLVPPPLFVVEAYAAAYEANFHEERREGALKRIAMLKAQYDARRDYWLNAGLPADELAALKNDVLRTADDFWDVIENRFVKVVGGDYAVMDPVMERLADAYAEQRRAAEALNTVSASKLAGYEQEAGHNVSILGGASAIFGAASILLFIAGVLFIRARAITPVVKVTAVMETLARGDFETPVPYVRRRDEIGQMAGALEVFRDAGLAKLQLERDAEQAAAQRRDERLQREAEARRWAEEINVVVDRLGAGLQRLSDCNIRMTIDEPFAATFEQVRHDFNKSLAAFQVTLERVLNGTIEIREGSTELSAAATNMAHRTEQQAAALEETSAALEEINGTIANLIANTDLTRKLVGEARGRASGSNTVVDATMRAMQRIERSAGEIGQIIGVIDEIAFQTNLLALNAGVEAARAGESGKGFAVVATEVRELAQRSAAAAKQIKELVANSATEVHDGVRLVGETGKVLTEIADFVSRIDTNIDGIAVSVREQATGLGQTTIAIQQLDATTQQNAAMAEQTSALSKTLADQAQMLSAEVDRFKLNRRRAIREPGSAAALAGPSRAA